MGELSMSEYEFVLISQLADFGRSHSLSERELELVYLLAIGESSTDAIATKLGVSSFTVSNHLKRIYSRTATSSKPELISKFTDQLLHHFVKLRFAQRSHRVVLLGLQNPDLEKRLQQVHLQIVERARVKDSCVDLAICNAEGPWRQQLIEFKRQPGQIILINATERRKDQDIAESLLPGTHPDEIVFYSLYHLLEQNYERSRFHRVKANTNARIQRPYSVKDISLGGLFIVVPRNDDLLQSDIGSEIHMSLEINKSIHTVSGFVAWSRAENRLHRPSGLGIRFGKMEEETQQTIKDHVVKTRMGQLLRLQK